MDIDRLRAVTVPVREMLGSVAQLIVVVRALWRAPRSGHPLKTIGELAVSPSVVTVLSISVIHQAATTLGEYSTAASATRIAATPAASASAGKPDPAIPRIARDRTVSTRQRL
jgi:hypothetical protein